METRESILNTTKVNLGIHPSYTPFDLQLVTLINAVFSDLEQLGVGPSEGFFIEDENSKWEDFTIENNTEAQMNALKTLIALKVRLLFDPPTTSFVLTALQNQIQELTWRISVRREDTEWVDPFTV